jgi:hypothetical protein
MDLRQFFPRANAKAAVPTIKPPILSANAKVTMPTIKSPISPTAPAYRRSDPVSPVGMPNSPRLRAPEGGETAIVSFFGRKAVAKRRRPGTAPQFTERPDTVSTVGTMGDASPSRKRQCLRGSDLVAEAAVAAAVEADRLRDRAASVPVRPRPVKAKVKSKSKETETETAAELKDRGLAAFGEKDFQVSHRR